MLNVERVAFGWHDAVPLLSDVSFRLEAGWTGLVGANGAGKSSLLRIVAGTLKPEAGLVRSSGAVHHCPQDVGVRDGSIDAFAWGWTGPDAWRIQATFDLDPARLASWDDLSPGERRRWQIGAALASAPAVLLLDEPTNHLDQLGRDALVEALTQFAGVGVLVSHDRSLLQAVCSRTMRLARGQVDLLDLPYDHAAQVWTAERDRALAQRDAASEAARAASLRLRRARDNATAAEAARGKLRTQGKHDSDARTITARNKVEWGAGAAARTAKRSAAIHAQLESARQQAAVPKELGADVQLPGTPARQAVVATMTGELATPDGRVLASDLDVVVGRQDRLWIRGPNGAGKSTLLHLLCQSTQLSDDAVLYLPQELTEADRAALVAALHALEPEVRGRTLQGAAALGLDPARLLVAGACSPGEARKLALAMAMGREASLLVLDEPTNDLDLPAVERLQRALVGWGAALVLVTHDGALGEAVATRRVVL